MKFTEREAPGPDGGRELDLGKEGGHSKRRILHAKDVTGREIERALLAAVAAQPNMACSKTTSPSTSSPARSSVMRARTAASASTSSTSAPAGVDTFAAPVTLLATGGCGKVYLYTTNPDVATGDGVAMAYRAGAAIANMEFIQFHPTCLYHPEAKSFLISEAVRGEGGILQTVEGRHSWTAIIR